MLYYNLNDPSVKADFAEATIQGQAPGRGLYFPERIPALPRGFIQSPSGYSPEAIAYELIHPYTGGTIPEKKLEEIVAETVSFPFPLVPVEDRVFALELFHGPTLAFKDVGARFMSRCLGYFVRNRNREVTVLVATSGDTGGAVASGFLGVEGVNVVILYPKGKVSRVQELQLTTPGQNIRALQVDGSFDDCQRMVKQAFSDEALSSLFLTSANSINVARWLPQQFYYCFALQQWRGRRPPVISVPSGNFGNIAAGLLARQSGLPVQHFVAATNINDVVTRYLQTGQYEPTGTRATLSNAMDVGDPSNFIRVLELFEQRFASLKAGMSGERITDAETAEAISALYQSAGYMLDPHGAVAYLSLKRCLQDRPDESGIFLATAHPVKFYNVIEPVIGKPVEQPESIKALLHRDGHSIPVKTYEEVQAFLLELS